MHLLVVLFLFTLLYLVCKTPFIRSLHALERNWITYPKSAMALAVALSNTVFVFTTIVEARTTQWYWYDEVVIAGVVAAFMAGFCVDVKPLA